MNTEPRAIAFLCDEYGKIQSLLQDTLKIADMLPFGAPLPRWAVRGSVGKALSFLNELRAQGRTGDWEINVNLRGTVASLHFIGGRQGEQLLIVAAREFEHAQQCYRMLQPEVNEPPVAAAHLQLDYYDELSRVNNELINAQRKLAQQNAELERLNREKNRFLGMAAHDLRSPLHALMLYSELLLEDNLTSQQREYLTVIFESSEFLSNLVDNLLDVAKIEAGQLDLYPQRIALAQWFARILALHRPLAAKQQIEIVLQAENLPEYAIFDADKMAQVLQNLLDNAIKFSPPNTSIILTAAAQNQNLLLRVRDYGPGIGAAQQAHLFEFFSRGIPVQPDGQKNTGLGLAICRRIVEAHGGKIGFTPAEPHGAIFWVELPLA
ncbi:MAG: hypothetical protein OHK0052_08270 [Anaerolineales bacterium]